MSRAIAAVLVAAAACTTSIDYRPIDPAALRARLAEPVGPDAAFVLHDHGPAEPIGELARACGSGSACPLDDAGASWQLGERHRHVDVTRVTQGVLDGVLLGGLVYGNVECFALDGCSHGWRVAMGVTDGVLAIGTVALGVLVVEIALHARSQ